MICQRFCKVHDVNYANAAHGQALPSHQAAELPLNETWTRLVTRLIWLTFAIWHEIKTVLCEDLPRTSCFASFYCMIYSAIFPVFVNAVMKVLILVLPCPDSYLPIGAIRRSHSTGWPGFCERFQSWWSLWRQALGNLKNWQDNESLWF